MTFDARGLATLPDGPDRGLSAIAVVPDPLGGHSVRGCGAAYPPEKVGNSECPIR